jgi:hypothetical protein
LERIPFYDRKLDFAAIWWETNESSEKISTICTGWHDSNYAVGGHQDTTYTHYTTLSKGAKHDSLQTDISRPDPKHFVEKSAS